MSRIWAACEDLWALISRFAARRARGCHQRMRQAAGLPALPEIPARPAGEGEPIR